jgi:sensor histidine kinase YesM
MFFSQLLKGRWPLRRDLGVAGSQTDRTHRPERNVESMKHKWAFLFLWPNVAVAVTALVLILANYTSSIREVLQFLARALLYANLVALFGALLVGWLAKVSSFRKPPLIALLAFCVFVVVPVGCLLVQTLLMAIGAVAREHFWRDYLFTQRLSIPAALIFGAGALVHASLRDRVQHMEEKLHEKEVAEERAHKLAAEARLHSLESRIHPHFLFNTLNSISSLIALDPERAEQIVGRLAVLLRASLDTSNQPLIPLRQELAMVESYIDIERVRIGGKLHGSVSVPAELMDTQVPPMSVQSLVENAVKHGVAPQSGGGEVLVTASADSGELRIEVRDTGPGFDLAAIRAGHGLDNLVGRLDALFGAKARLNNFRRDGYSVVEMVLPRA